ncbi:MAG TPA: MauE/DoxX family redox-associated membrane protein [Bryobacteraceae bacterium]|nr:MauE/DoxX family redox-associated membrane protein [Bryobacteraceae bacterium]
MNDSMAQPHAGFGALELPGWKTALSWVAAALIALLFLASGLWKITDVQGAAMRMAQAKVPESLSQAAAILFGIAETVGGVLILVPRFRRWGSIVTSVLLVAFLIYIAIHYNALRGEECSCFPWLKRAVGPGFFIGDGIMLVLAVCAGIWSKRPESLRSAFLILGAVVVFALVSYGVAEVRQTGTKAPDTTTVQDIQAAPAADGTAAPMPESRPYSLQRGKIFLFFFDPQCMHCFDAAKRMSKMAWGETKIVAIPVEMPQYASQFLRDTGLKAVISSDFSKLAPLFSYTAYPYGVALENGREKAPITKFEGDEPQATLKQLGLVQ